MGKVSGFLLPISVSLILLVFTTMAVLTFATARADHALTDRSIAFAQAYYEAERDAQVLLSEMDAVLRSQPLSDAERALLLESVGNADSAIADALRSGANIAPVQLSEAELSDLFQSFVPEGSVQVMRGEAQAERIDLVYEREISEQSIYRAQLRYEPQEGAKRLQSGITVRELDLEEEIEVWDGSADH